MQLDHDRLHRLLEALGESDIQEFRLEGEDFLLEVKRNLPAPAVVASALPMSSISSVIPPTVPSSSEVIVAGDPPPAGAGARADLVDVTAPMVGTLYRAPAPGEPPFVEIGSRINTGQTICILEAMKLMNELEAEISGEVIEILVDNGTPVEFGQVLMRIKPS